MHDSTVTHAWLVLTHHLPTEPAYFRVKVRRRLERIGAVPLKSSVYVLPSSDDALEDFQWLFQEIERDGGEATLAEARFRDGVTDARLVERFREAREADFRELADAARSFVGEAEGASPADGARTPETRVRRLTRRLEEVMAIDFFEADGRASAEQAVEEARRLATGDPRRPDPAHAGVPEPLGTGRTWVTRRGVKVDRMASAWLIRRFVDPDARFRFVPPDGHDHREGELRFDMLEGEFTHEGDQCTFETLLARRRLDDRALDALAEIVHDIDCKDDRFGRAETPGVASLLDGIVRTVADDEVRLQRGAALLDELYAHFRARAM
jgi:hypothetical protein